MLLLLMLVGLLPVVLPRTALGSEGKDRCGGNQRLVAIQLTWTLHQKQEHKIKSSASCLFPVKTGQLNLTFRSILNVIEGMSVCTVL